MDAFISWTSADRDVKNVLVQKLKDAGITCWDSDEECTSDYSAQCIAAIRNCGVFIVIVSDASMQKGYVINEVIEAKSLSDEGKLNIVVYKITDAPYTDAFKFQLNHITITNGNLIQRKESLSTESPIDIVVKRAKALLKARADGNPEKPFDVAVPEINGLKISKGGYFVENSRNETLNAIDDAFSQSNVIILEEFVGYGKRSVIRKYVDLHANSITTAIQPNNFQGDLRSFFLTDLNFKNINSDRFSSVEGNDLIKEKLEVLQKLNQDTLLIIPNVSFDATPDQELCQGLLNLKCKIVLLTQNSVDTYKDWFPIIKLGKMENQYLRELFFHNYTRAAFDEDKEMLFDTLESFFSYIGGHTKTVELTASVLNRELGIFPEDVPNYLTTDSDEGLQLKDRIFSQLSNIIGIEQLSDQHNVALLVAACLAAPQISERAYRDVLKTCGVTDYQIVLDLDRRGWIELDLPNQTISIEPLVAQIIYDKFSNNYTVLFKCLDYLLQLGNVRIVSALTPSTYLSFLSKTEHFVELIGLEEIAQLISTFKRAYADSSSDNSNLLAEAVKVVEATYPKSMCDELDPDDAVTSLEQLQLHAISLFYSSIFPNCKLLSFAERSLFYNYSHTYFDTYGLEMQSVVFGDDFLGFSQEEIEEYIEYLASTIEQSSCDGNTSKNLAFAEMLSIISAILHRTPQNVDERIDNILNYISLHPEFLEDPDNAQVFSITITCLCNVYIASHTYSAIVLLFERILSVCNAKYISATCWQGYITALEKQNIYNDDLFNAYDVLIKGFDQLRDLYKSPEEWLRDKKKTILFYADSLAFASRFELAEQKFAQAIKINVDGLFDECITTVHNIIDSYIKSGHFVSAVKFAQNPYLYDIINGNVANHSKQHSETIELLTHLQSFDLNATEDSFIENDLNLDYYQQYSRENHAPIPKKYFEIAESAMQFDFSSLSNQEITEYANRLREKAATKPKMQLAAEAFALASEAGYRVLGYRHHHVQYLGALAMIEGKIAEILNGEGKTYTVVLVAFLNALYGERVFVVDGSDFLTQRNYLWMRGVYSLLGIDCQYINPDERYSLCEYKSDVYYTTLASLIFSYLRAELHPDCVDGDLAMSCIIDEADTVLVDSATVPYLITETTYTAKNAEECSLVWKVIKRIENHDNYYFYENGSVTLCPEIYPLLEAVFGFDWTAINQIEHTIKLEKLVRNAILACFVYEENKDYFIHNGLVLYEEKSQGSFKPFTPEKEYFLRKRHSLPTDDVLKVLSRENSLLNTITAKDFFKKCKNVCGTTATAVSFCNEFKEIYGLDYAVIPPHKPCVRKTLKHTFFFSQEAKETAILDLVEQKQKTGQPVLICTQSVAESEHFSELLNANGITHKLLNAKNESDVDALVALAGLKGSILVANSLTNRGADIKLGGDPEIATRQELVNMGVDISKLDEFLYSIPTPELLESKLYNQYHSLLQKNRIICDQNKKEVMELGGLCVIATSFFAEPRNEQQTCGRAGRQGDPGEAHVLRCIDDASLCNMFGDKFKGIVNTLEDGVESKLLNHAIKKQQKALHDRTFYWVRQANKNSLHIDLARPDLIGRICALNSKTLTIEDIIEEWASDESILNQLKNLQAGAQSCESRALLTLWNNNPSLKDIKLRRAPQIITSLIIFLIEEQYENEDLLKEKLQRYICMHWKKHINLIDLLVQYSNMSEDDLYKFLTKKRRSVRIEPADELIRNLLTAK